MPIFDQGYQHWRGPLSGRANRWLTIALQGARVQLKGRGLRGLMIISWLPALALVIAMALWGLVEKKSEGMLALVSTHLPADMLLEPRAYRSTVWTLAYFYFFNTQMFFIMLLVAVAGPGLISSDLRFNALPLYFSRPLTRLDYFIGKLGVIGYLVASVAVGPAIFAYVVGLCFSLDPNVIKDTWKILLASIAYGLIVTISAGTLMLAMSSLSRRSLYIGIAWAGLWIISSSVGGAMTGIHREMQMNESFKEARDELAKWETAHPPPPGIHLPVRGRRPLFPRGWQGPPIPGEVEWSNAQTEAAKEIQKRINDRQLDELRHDWRPLFSYVANLERIAHALLNTDAAYVTFGKAAGRVEGAAMGVNGDAGDGPNDRRLADLFVPQYPWQWSAGVLAGLLGLSTWTMTRRVRSLDRLK